MHWVQAASSSPQRQLTLTCVRSEQRPATCTTKSVSDCIGRANNRPNTRFTGWKNADKYVSLASTSLSRLLSATSACSVSVSSLRLRAASASRPSLVSRSLSSRSSLPIKQRNQNGCSHLTATPASFRLRVAKSCEKLVPLVCVSSASGPVDGRVVECAGTSLNEAGVSCSGGAFRRCIPLLAFFCIRKLLLYFILVFDTVSARASIAAFVGVETRIVYFFLDFCASNHKPDPTKLMGYTRANQPMLNRYLGVLRSYSGLFTRGQQFYDPPVFHGLANAVVRSPFRDVKQTKNIYFSVIGYQAVSYRCATCRNNH